MGSPQSGCQSFQLSHKCLFTCREVGKVTFPDRPPLQEGLQRVRMGGGGVEKGL